VRLTIDAEGRYFWNESPVSDAELDNRLATASALPTQPELHIRGDKAVRYERVALAMAAAQRAGLRKIGFVTEPKAP
jgi:biopolymer transport protein ExbD